VAILSGMTTNLAGHELPTVGRLRSALGGPVPWTLLAFLMSWAPLIERQDDTSALWWLGPMLFGGYLLAWVARSRWTPWRPSPVVGSVAYLVMTWVAAVLYELTLSTGGGANLGGLAEDTRTSFLLLPGYIVPASLFTLWMTRRYGLDARSLFFVAGIMTWYETLTVGTAYLVGAPLLAPVVIAFYVASYAIYNGALGLLLIDPSRLHGAQVRSISTVRRLAYGVMGGAACWVVFVAWAELIM
jgi:hypothetical protein